MGYYVLSNEEILCKLDNILKWIVLLFAASTSILIYAYSQWSYYGDFLVNFTGWMGILTFIVLAKKYLDQKTAFTTYFNSASFPIYILHQSILVALAYYVLPAVNGLIFQICIIVIGSFGATLLSYHLLKNIPFVRNMLGIYKKNGIQ
jgi:peptidoglycan/LPS O-acetylase OafA/YrhL